MEASKGVVRCENNYIPKNDWFYSYGIATKHYMKNTETIRSKTLELWTTRTYPFSVRYSSIRYFDINMVDIDGIIVTPMSYRIFSGAAKPTFISFFSTIII